MKKISFLFLMALGLNFSKAQMTESFDSATLPSGWTVINQGDTEEWMPYTSYSSITPHTGSHFLGLKYGNIAHDDYVISPAITVTSGVSDKLTFWGRNLGAGLVEKIDIKVSTTTPTVGAFTNTLVSNLAPPTTWTEYTYDLTPFVGQTIYIAFYSSTTNIWFIGIDDFSISANALDVSDSALRKTNVYPNPVTNILFIEGQNKISDVEIYDVSGKKAASPKAEMQGKISTVNLEHLPVGIYMLRYTDGKRSETRKIIKK